MDELLPIFEREGVQLIIEPRPDDFIEDGLEAVKMIRGLNNQAALTLHRNPRAVPGQGPPFPLLGSTMHQKENQHREPDLRLHRAGSTRDGCEFRHGSCHRPRLRRLRGPGCPRRYQWAMLAQPSAIVATPRVAVSRYEGHHQRQERTMHIRPKPPTVKNSPEQFTGDVWFDVIASPQDENQRMVVGIVRFAPGARTAWHSHANGQTLHVTHGVARMQARGGDIIEVQAGQTVYTPPGEEHWHGAAPDDFMEHLAMFENSDDPNATTDWGQHVTDEEYNTSRH
jgi:quercetin dioxygenase-like cupin family protein